jgi:hypothetical protein
MVVLLDITKHALCGVVKQAKAVEMVEQVLAFLQGRIHSSR